MLNRFTARLTTPAARGGVRLALALRYVLWAATLLLVTWIIVDPRFRNAEGALRASVGLPLAASLALLIVGWGITSRWRIFSGWLALALVGQAAALQLIDAGIFMRYQHLKPPAQMLADAPLALVVVLLQTIVVASGLLVRGPGMVSWRRGHFRLWHILALGLLLVVASAAPSRDLRAYAIELGMASFLALLNLATVVLTALALPAGAASALAERGEVWLTGSAAVVGGRRQVDRFAWLAALWVFVLAAFLSFFVYQNHPHIQDETAYLMHARFLAQGALTLPAPPVPAVFDFYLMELDGSRWYPSPPPGWPLFLALGVRVGMPWLVNPTLAALSVLLTYLLLQALYDRRTARLAVLLLCISPWFLFMAMNLMTHTATLFCALLAALGVVWARETGQARWAWLGGAALGMVSLIRPLEGVALAALLGLWALGVGGARLKPGALAGLILGAALVGGAVLPYNAWLTGDPSVFPINAYTDRVFGPGSNAVGFGPNRGAGWPLQPYPGHSPAGAAVNALLNTASLNTELFGWGIGSLLPAALFIIVGLGSWGGSLGARRWPGRVPHRPDQALFQTGDLVMLAVILVIFTVHVFYWFSGGPDFGARYWYLMLIPLIALTARGWLYLARLAEGGETVKGRSGYVLVAVVLLAALTVVNYLPWRALDKYYHYLNMRPDVRILAQEYNLGRSLVLVQGDEHPDYASAAVYNPLNFDADAPIYARDLGPESRAALRQVFPDRPLWVLAGPTLTGQGYRVAAAP